MCSTRNAMDGWWITAELSSLAHPFRALLPAQVGERRPLKKVLLRSPGRRPLGRELSYCTQQLFWPSQNDQSKPMLRISSNRLAPASTKTRARRFPSSM